MKNGHHYSIETDYAYFLTRTIVDWVDLFTRVNHNWNADDTDFYDFRKKFNCECHPI